MLSEETKSRLENWKFDTAKWYLDWRENDATDFEASTIRTLASLFGNCGWFDGDMGQLVYLVVTQLVGKDD